MGTETETSGRTMLDMTTTAPGAMPGRLIFSKTDAMKTAKKMRDIVRVFASLNRSISKQADLIEKLADTVERRRKHGKVHRQ